MGTGLSNFNLINQLDGLFVLKRSLESILGGVKLALRRV